MPLSFISGHWLCHCQTYSGSPLQNSEFGWPCLQSRWDSQIPAVCSPVQTKGEWQSDSSWVFLMFLLAEVGNGHKIFRSSGRLNASRCMLEPKRFLVCIWFRSTHLDTLFTVFVWTGIWRQAVTLSQCQLCLNCVSICVCVLSDLKGVWGIHCGAVQASETAGRLRSH